MSKQPDNKSDRILSKRDLFLPGSVTICSAM